MSILPQVVLKSEIKNNMRVIDLKTISLDDRRQCTFRLDLKMSVIIDSLTELADRRSPTQPDLRRNRLRRRPTDIVA